MQQCKKVNSLDQILTTVVNPGHLMDFAGSVPGYTRKQMGSFSFFIPYQHHHHVYFILLLVFICDWCFLPMAGKLELNDPWGAFQPNPFCDSAKYLLAYFFFSGAADVLWAVLQGRDAVCYHVSACVALPFPFLLLPGFVEQMVLIPMVALDTAEVSSLMPLLYPGNSLWCFWKREHTVDYCLLFTTFKILLGLYFFLLCSFTSPSNLSQRSVVWNSLRPGEYCFSLLL